MRVGLLYDMANPAHVGRAPAEFYAHELGQIERAEALGIDGVWFTEHHFTTDYICSPIVMMAAAAARTRTIRIGTGILIPSLYHPVRLAEDLAVVDVLSNGRLELGAGLGWSLEEFATFGVETGQRVSVVREALEVLRLAWTQESFSFHGRHFDFDDVRVEPKPVQKPYPTIWGGASTVDGASRVARWRLPLLWVDPVVSRGYLDAWAAQGFPADEARIDGYINMFVCDDPEATWPKVRENFLYQARRPDIRSNRAGKGGATVARGPGSANWPSLDDIEARRAAGDILVVTPAQAVAAVRARSKGFPVNGFFCHNRVCGMSDELSERHVTLLATEVAPALRADQGGRHD